MQELTVSESQAGQTLAAILRQHLGLTWNAARTLCQRGKVFCAGERRLDPSERPASGAIFTIRENAPAPLPARLVQASQAIVFEDSQVVVVDKPAGISSVPYERGETGTAMDLIRDAWRVNGQRATDVPLHIVHRIDKETSGLLMFAKTRGAERALQALLRAHDIDRSYLCVAHGTVRPGRIESRLVEDRGDGLRGSPRPRGPWAEGRTPGKLAITDVEVTEQWPEAALCEVRLHTGKTHQIRIHLAESTHPLVGEKVYIRDFVRYGGQPLPSGRLLLHARTLGFVHPTSGEKVQLCREPPEDFMKEVRALRRARRS